MHPKQKVLAILLALGAVGGYSLGFMSLHCHGHSRRAAFERHIAQICTDAARDSKRGAAVDSQ
ncbi:hypothetical protein [Pendulispora albinea]|uniref:Uncharacterized protein n=1 Tax=Pendulispora albinea TaxID=2741071 RepID=A0ABZ2LQ69_9BACT